MYVYIHRYAHIYLSSYNTTSFLKPFPYWNQISLKHLTHMIHVGVITLHTRDSIYYSPSYSKTLSFYPEKSMGPNESLCWDCLQRDSASIHHVPLGLSKLIFI